MRRAIAALVVAILVGLSAGQPVHAHPHVWADALAMLVFKEGRLTTIRMQWAFDEFFSLVLYEDFDFNRNGTFDDDEIEAMRRGAFAGLGEVNFFTDLRIDGEQVAWEGARNFGVAVSDSGIVAYSFSLDVPEPADPLDQAITLAVYDPEYYVSLEFLQSDPLRYIGMEDQGCSYAMEEASDTPLYFGAVFPTRAVLTCSGKSG